MLLSTGLASRAQSIVFKGGKEDFKVKLRDLIQAQAWGYKYNFGYGKCSIFTGCSDRKRNCEFEVEERKVYNNQMDSESIKVQVGKTMST